MKICPVCAETYSERIDFCFSDGAVLTLMPSAMDAPMPRLVAQTVAAAAVSRLKEPTLPDPDETAEAERSLISSEDTTVEIPAPDEHDAPALPTGRTTSNTGSNSAAASPAPAEPRTPTPAKERSQPASDDRAGVVGTHVPSPERIAVAPVVAPMRDEPKVVPTGFDDLSEGHDGALNSSEPDKEEDNRGALVWFFATAAVVLAAVVMVVTLMRDDGPTRPTREVITSIPVATPAPAAVQTPALPSPATTPTNGPTNSPPTVATPGSEAVGLTPTPGFRPGRDDRAPATPPPVEGAIDRTPAPTPRAPIVQQRDDVVRPAPTPTPAGPGVWDAPAAPTSGRALFSSDPPGARLRVDGVDVGLTPVEIQLGFGDHAVELDLAGYVPVRKRVDVQSGAPKFPETLTRVVRTGNVLVAFEGWDGASLWVDGADKGTLPVNVLLAEGMHTFEVRGDKGQVKLRREVKLAEQGLTRLLLHE